MAFACASSCSYAHALTVWPGSSSWFCRSWDCARAMNGPQKSVTAKMAVAPAKAARRVDGSSRSAATISTPLAVRALDAADDGLRVRPRIRQWGGREKGMNDGAALGSCCADDY